MWEITVQNPVPPPPPLCRLIPDVFSFLVMVGGPGIGGGGGGEGCCTDISHINQTAVPQPQPQGRVYLSNHLPPVTLSHPRIPQPPLTQNHIQYPPTLNPIPTQVHTYLPSYGAPPPPPSNLLHRRLCPQNWFHLNQHPRRQHDDHIVSNCRNPELCLGHNRQ